MASPTDPKASISPTAFPSPPSQFEEEDDDNMDPVGDDEIQEFNPPDSILVESVPLSPLPPPDGLSPPPPGQEDASMRSLPSDESMSDEEEEGDGDDEDDDEESEGLDAAALQQEEYIVPLKEADDVDDSTRDLSENSLSVNGSHNNAVTKIEFGESLTRGGKLRRLAPPPPLKRRKTSVGRSRTPRAPTPVIPPRSTSPWPEIQESDIRDMEDRDVKRRRTSTRQEPNGTKEYTPQPATAPSRNSRRLGKEETVISAEERLKRSKRVKISPRKEKQVPNRQRSPPHPLTAALSREEAVSGSATPRFIINMKTTEKEDSDPTRYNEEICGACGGPGRFLCCEGCPKSFHFTCLDPPIDENDLPEDSWYISPNPDDT